MEITFVTGASKMEDTKLVLSFYLLEQINHQQREGITKYASITKVIMAQFSLIDVHLQGTSPKCHHSTNKFNSRPGGIK